MIGELTLHYYFLDIFTTFIHSELIETVCIIVLPFFLFYQCISIIKYLVMR